MIHIPIRRTLQPDELLERLRVRDLPHRALIILPSVVGCPIEVPGRIQADTTVGVRAIGSVAYEIVQIGIRERAAG